MGVTLFHIAFGSYLPKSTPAIAPHPRVTEALGIKREREQRPGLLFDENCIGAILPINSSRWCHSVVRYPKMIWQQFASIMLLDLRCAIYVDIYG